MRRNSRAGIGWSADRQERRQAGAQTGRKAGKEVLRNSRAGIGWSADR